VLRIECRHIVVQEASVCAVVDHVEAQRAFGAAARQLREAQGVSQEEMATRCGVHRTYLGGVERGERNLSWTKIVDFATGLGVPVAELTGLAEAKLREPG